jgi:hypothetical protein
MPSAAATDILKVSKDFLYKLIYFGFNLPLGVYCIGLRLIAGHLKTFRKF